MSELEDVDTSVRIAAAEALGRFRDKRAADSLIALLLQPTPVAQTGV